MEQTSTNMETIKEGDYVSYDCSFGKQFGYYVTLNIVEIIGDWGWSRSNSIPESYTPRGSYKYWYVNNIQKCEEPKPSVECDFVLINGEVSLSLSSPDRTYTTMMHNAIYTTGDGMSLWNASHEGIIKSNLYKDMNIIDKIRVNIKREPMKTLIKNEVLTLDERLTTTGKELFNDFLYDKFKDEFIADIAPKLEGLTLEK